MAGPAPPGGCAVTYQIYYYIKTWLLGTELCKSSHFSTMGLHGGFLLWSGYHTTPRTACALGVAGKSGSCCHHRLHSLCTLQVCGACQVTLLQDVLLLQRFWLSIWPCCAFKRQVCMR